MSAFFFQHGAHYIYDSDDDTLPINDLQDFHLSSFTNTEGLLIDTKNLTFNPCPHFGQSTLWPRGYPLNHVGLSSPHSYSLCTLHNPVVRQGLINKDPDVDAIIRLTRKHQATEIDLNFDGAAPPVVIPKGTFVPINTQATVVTYEGLWSLVLPQSLSARKMDIVRGYWMQPLLWLIDQRVGYYPAVSKHFRNPHNILKDAIEEEGFLEVEQMLHVLRKWQCSKPHFFGCVTDLSMRLVSEGIWHQNDADLVNAWLTDLAMVGYFPPMIKSSRERECAGDHLDVEYYSAEQKTMMGFTKDMFIIPQRHPELLTLSHSHSLCNTTSQLTSTFDHFNEVILIIGIHSAEHIPVLETWYRPRVPNILYCLSSSTKFTNEHQISILRLNDGSASPVHCIKLVMSLHSRVAGYLYIDEHSLLNVEKLIELKQSQPWLSSEVYKDKDSVKEMCQKKILQCQTLSQNKVKELSEKLLKLDAGTKLKTRLKTCFDTVASGIELQKDILAVVDTAVYIPDRLQHIFLLLADSFIHDREAKMYTVVIPLVLNCIEATPEVLTLSPPYGTEKHVIFPFPVEQIISTKNTKEKLNFCAAALE